jgi:serine protease Do
MPKPSPKSEPPPSSPRRPAPSGGQALLVYRVLKLAAFVVGLPAALLCGMAAVGAVTDNGYARVLVSALVVLGVPLAIADRLLPADHTRAKGLVSDVCAVTWMVIAFGFAAAGGGLTRPLLAREGDRLVSSGHGDIAQGAYLLAGVKVEPTLAADGQPAASGSAAVGAADAGAVDAGAAPAVADDAGAAGDAGVARPKGAQKPGEKTPAELYKEASPAVVTVSNFRGGSQEGSGTGFLIDGEGTIATNHHVIQGAMRVQVKFQSGALFDDVELLVDESSVDLALLRVDLAAPADGGRTEAKPLALGSSDVEVGEHVVVIGNPLGLDSTLTDGLVSQRRIYDGRAWIQFSAPIGSGNSGGPVLNTRGEVIGVTTASLHGAPVAQNINLAVPLNELKKLIRAEYPSRRKLGQPSPGHW